MKKRKLHSGLGILFVLLLTLPFLTSCGKGTDAAAAPAEAPAPAEAAAPAEAPAETDMAAAPAEAAASAEAAAPAEAPAETDAEKADRLLSEGRFDEAYTLLRELGRDEEISASRYERGLRFYEEGDLVSAGEMFEGLDYRDSEQYLSVIRAYGALSEAKAGETVFLGNYEQDGSAENGREPVEWLVLDRNDEGLLLLSVYALDCVDFASADVPVTWKESIVRDWLNTEFFDVSFSDAEKKLIACVNTEGEETSLSEDGSDSDRVFLLSVTEADRYLPGGQNKTCYCTKYAIQNGSWYSYDRNICRWWLRTDGNTGNRKAGVRHQGTVYTEGFFVNLGYMSVRPAVFVSLPD